MADPIVTCDHRDGVALVRMDDGKANALSHAAIDSLHRALDETEKEGEAVVWAGRPGRFSGGFDLAVMRSGPEAVRDLVTAGAELFLRILAHPRPVVVACTGHAIAAGALALLGGDLRLGARGDFRIGLNEVAIGMTLPLFALEMAEHRLAPTHLFRATAQAELFGPEFAVAAGYLDAVADPDALLATAESEARRLGEMPRAAFAETKRRIHADFATRLRTGLEQDMRALTAAAQP